MKEIMAFLRMNRINDTKAALAKAGYPSFTVSKAVGRGKKPLASTGRFLKQKLRTGIFPLCLILPTKKNLPERTEQGGLKFAP